MSSHWTACTDEMPDADLTVLIGTNSDAPCTWDCGGVWLGWWDGEDWMEVGGSTIPKEQWPTHWQDLPDPPQPPASTK